MTFELRLVGYRKKVKSIVVEGEMSIGVELEKLPGVGKGSGKPGTGSGSAKAPKGSNDRGLIRPGD